MGKIYNEIIDILEDICEEKINEEMSIFEDLKFDSVQIIELVLMIEEQYDFDFERYDELMEHMDTVRDFAHYFETYVTEVRGEESLIDTQKNTGMDDGKI